MMMRRIFSKFIVLMLLCVPVVAVIGWWFLRTTEIQQVLFASISPISAGLFFIVGIYFASILQHREVWAKVWYVLAGGSMLFISIGVLISLRYQSVGYIVSHYLPKGFSISEAWIFGLLGISMLLWLPIRSIAQWITVAVVVYSFYEIFARALRFVGILIPVHMSLITVFLFLCIGLFMLLYLSSWWQEVKRAIHVVTRSPVVKILGTFLVSMVCLSVLWYSVTFYTQIKARTSFEASTQQVARTVERSFDRYTNVLDGFTALFAATHALTEQQWQSYVHTLAVDTTYPDIGSIAYVAKFSDKEIKNLPYAIYPLIQKNEYYPITYLSTFSDISEGIGFDIESDSKQIDILKKAVDEKEIKIARIHHGQHTGFSLVSSIYKDGIHPKTIEERRSSVTGFVLISFDFVRIIESIAQQFHASGIEVVSIQSDALLWSAPNSASIEMQRTIPIQLFDSTWYVTVGHVAKPFMSPYALLIGGLISIIISLFISIGVFFSRKSYKKNSFVQKGTFPLFPVKTDIVGLVGQLVQEQAFLCKQKKQAISFEHSKRIPSIVIDSNALRILLQYIFTLSYLYTPEKGSLEISIKTSGSKKTDVSIVCADTGTIRPVHAALFSGKEDTVYDEVDSSMRLLYQLAQQIGCNITFEVKDNRVVTTCTISRISSEEEGE